MALTSLNFGIFLLSAVLVYWSGDFWLKRIFKTQPANDANDHARLQAWRSGWLAAACMVFLLSWSVQAALTLLVIAIANFLLGQVLSKEEKRRSLVLWLGIGFNLLALVGLKYAGFYLPAITALIKTLGGQDSGALQILMPIGLSFISVQMISYLIDVYRRQAKPETDWVRFCIYGLYFPKILSGPIERARTFLPRLANPQPLTDQSLARALGLIGVGLVRKVIIANSLYALLPDDLFVTPLNYPAQLLALWLAAYSFYLYNDFAGYSSLARGISGLFGIELTQNFNTPFAAQNFSDFWNRWHISLSAWLRDYIYFPLARALRTRIPDSEHKIHVILPPLVTMAVSGLWHGIGWNMLLWGGLHGVYQVVERLLTLNTPKAAPTALLGQPLAKTGWRQRLAPLVVFVFVTLAWIPFRMELKPASRYLAGLILPSNWRMPDFYWLGLILTGREQLSELAALNLPDPRLLLFLGLAFWLDKVQADQKNEMFFLHWKAWRLAAVCVLVVAGMYLLSFADLAAPFVYQGF